MAAAKENSNDKSGENFDPIWSFIEEKLLHESVPNYIKYVLSYCGYNNGITIASIDDDDINYCIEEVRNGSVTSYYESKMENKNVLEGCRKTSETFEFCRGHLRFITDIVEMLKKYIKENGVDCFNVEQKKASQKQIKKRAQTKKPTGPKKKMKSSTVTKNTSLILENYHKPQPSKKFFAETPMEKHMRILVNKMLNSLRTHTPELYMQIAKNINTKITELVTVEEAELYECKSSHESESEEMVGKKSENNLERSTESGNAGGFTEKSSEKLTEENDEEMVEKLKKYTASMMCPYCWTSINVFYLVTRWNSSNFDRHLKLSHCTQDNEATQSNSEDEDEPQGARGGKKTQHPLVGHKTKDTPEARIVNKIDSRGGNKTQQARLSNKGYDANISNQSEGARGGTKDLVARVGKKAVAVCDGETSDGDAHIYEIIDVDTKNDTREARVVNKIDYRGGNKTEEARHSSKGHNANIANQTEGARGGTKNRVVPVGKKAILVRDGETRIRDVEMIEIIDADTKNDSRDYRVVNKIDSRGANTTQDTRHSNEGHDDNNANQSEGARGGTKNLVERVGKKTVVVRDGETSNSDAHIYEIIDVDTKNDTRDARVVNKIDYRGGNKTPDANIANQGASGGTKNLNARIGKKAEVARGSVIRDVEIIEIIADTKNDTENYLVVNKIGNKIRDAGHGNEGHDANIAN